MSELDFSDLTDDQIVELAVGLAREAMRRNPALQIAFQQALLDEKERVEAAMRGSARAKAVERKRIEEQAARADIERQKEIERKRRHDALAAYLRRAADIMGRDVKTLSLVWVPQEIGEWRPYLRIVTGNAGVYSQWYLVNYDVQKEYLRTSPGLHNTHDDLLPWARETAATIRALGIGRETVIRGKEI